jgi:hypothetical protein
VIDECFNEVEPLLGTKTACVATGRARATLYRRRRGPRVTVKRPRPSPPKKLSEEEAAAVLGVLDSERFVDCSPAQVYFTLLDEGAYLASESTFYRILRSNGEVRERRRQATHPARVKPELVADRPLVVWSWDIQCRRRHWMSPQVRRRSSPTEKSRRTRSGSGGAVTSGIVVRTRLRRPSLATMPFSAIRRSVRLWLTQ